MADDLYFIRSPNGLVKIGRSRNAYARFGRLQTLSPVVLELAAVLPACGADEGLWHLAFHDCRSHGEWFRWNNRVSRALKVAEAGGDWIGTLRLTIQPALRRGAMSAPMVARLSRRPLRIVQ